MSKTPGEEDIISRIKKLEQTMRQIQTNGLLDLTLQADKKLYLDGTSRLTYIVWDSATSQLRVYVPDGLGGSKLAGYFDVNNTGTRIKNV